MCRRITPLAIALLAPLSGCAVRSDPGFNPYAAGSGEPTLLQAADGLMEAAERAVRDLDTRLEQAVY